MESMMVFFLTPSYEVTAVEVKILVRKRDDFSFANASFGYSQNTDR